jgi:hypothetical protein
VYIIIMHLSYIIVRGLWVQVSIFKYLFVHSSDFLHPENEGLGKISQKYLVAACIVTLTTLACNHPMPFHTFGEQIEHLGNMFWGQGKSENS